MSALWPPSRDRVAAHDVPVQLDSQTWLAWQGDRAVGTEFQLFACQLSPQPLVAELRRQVLDECAVIRDEGEMRGGGDGDPGLPAVGHNRDSARLRHVADDLCLPNAPNSTDVGLSDLDPADVHHRFKLKP